MAELIILSGILVILILIRDELIDIKIELEEISNNQLK